MKSNRANIFLSALPDRNGLPRAKTLGAAYTEEAIKERIKGVYIAKSKPLREDKKIRLVVDIENSIKAQQSAGL